MKQRRMTGLALALTLITLPAFPSGTQACNGEKQAFSEEARAELTALWDETLENARDGVPVECRCGAEAVHPNDECNLARSARGRLLAMLSTNPGALRAATPLAIEALEDERVTDAQAEVVFELLFDVRSPYLPAIAEAIHANAPARFDAGKLVTFCELGSSRLIEPLHDAVAQGDRNVFAAAFLASKGDDVGRDALAMAFQAKDVTVENAVDLLVAGIGLAELGRTGALPHAQKRVHDAAIAALDARQLDTARALAIRAAACRPAADGTYRGMSRVQSACEQRDRMTSSHGRLATAEQIRELIQEVTPGV